MALNFENIGTPVAKILDKNKKEINTVFLADLEIHQKPRHIMRQLNYKQMKPSNKFQIIVKEIFYTSQEHREVENLIIVRIISINTSRRIQIMRYIYSVQFQMTKFWIKLRS